MLIFLISPNNSSSFKPTLSVNNWLLKAFWTSCGNPLKFWTKSWENWSPLLLRADKAPPSFNTPFLNEFKYSSDFSCNCLIVKVPSLAISSKPFWISLELNIFPTNPCNPCPISLKTLFPWIKGFTRVSWAFSPIESNSSESLANWLLVSASSSLAFCIFLAFPETRASSKLACCLSSCALRAASLFLPSVWR